MRLTPGQKIAIEGHTLEYLRSSTTVNDRFTSVAAHIRVDGGKEYAPSLRQFPNNAQAIGTPSVRTSLVDDVYLSLLTAPADGDVVNVRVIIEPLAVWMWIGGAIMAFGAVLAAWPGRRRNPLDPVSAPVPTRRDDERAPTESPTSPSPRSRRWTDGRRRKTPRSSNRRAADVPRCSSPCRSRS